MASRTIGVCGEEGGWSSARLVEAFSARGCAVSFFEPRACSLLLPGGELPVVRHREEPLPDFDAVVVKKIGDVTHRATRGHLEILFALEARGAKVRSRPKAIAAAIDRVRMTRILAEHRIPMPRTIVTGSLPEALAFLSDVGTAVFKPAFTSKGRGMHRLTSGDPAARAILEEAARGDEPIYLQRFVERPEEGYDLGVAILDRQVIGAYKRVAPGGSWLTTIAQGGSYGAAKPPQEILDLALAAARPFHLTFTGVDIVETKEGPLVYEVSAFGGFRGLWETGRIDAAGLYADHVLWELSQG
ncbi:MAG: ATP-grasp family protein [Acidobacteriota bacterium]